MTDLLPPMPMAYAYTIDPERGRATVHVPRTVDVVGLLETQQALYLDDAWRPGMNELWDGRAIRQLDVSLGGLRAVAHQDATLRARVGSGRAAFVVLRHIDFSIARLYTALYRNSPQEMKVFQRLREAEAWLDEAAAE